MSDSQSSEIRGAEEGPSSRTCERRSDPFDNLHSIESNQVLLSAVEQSDDRRTLGGIRPIEILHAVQVPQPRILPNARRFVPTRQLPFARSSSSSSEDEDGWSDEGPVPEIPQASVPVRDFDFECSLFARIVDVSPVPSRTASMTLAVCSLRQIVPPTDCTRFALDFRFRDGITEAMRVGLMKHPSKKGNFVPRDNKRHVSAFSSQTSVGSWCRLSRK
jgi:hypothetical protein